MKTMKIYGYSGDEKTLAKELTRGVSIRNITHTGNGGLLVEYEEKKVGGRPKRDDSAQITMLRSGGMSYSQIADIVGCSKSHAQNVCRTISGNPDFKVFAGKRRHPPTRPQGRHIYALQSRHARSVTNRHVRTDAAEV